MIAEATYNFDLAQTITAIGAVAATLLGAGAFRRSGAAKRSGELAHKEAETTRAFVGTPNGNGPANEALHVVIEMLKAQGHQLSSVAESHGSLVTKIDGHMRDPNAHQR